jgi:hypothetical protein
MERRYPPDQTLTREQFTECFADYLRACGKLTQEEASEYADNVMPSWVEELGYGFGDPAYDWTESAAWDLASEDMSYWEG